MMLPGFGIVDVHSNAENLLLETFLLVSDMSAPALIGGWRSDGHEMLPLQCFCWAAASTNGAILGSRSRQRWQRAVLLLLRARCCASPSGHPLLSGPPTLNDIQCESPGRSILSCGGSCHVWWWVTTSRSLDSWRLHCAGLGLRGCRFLPPCLVHLTAL